MNLLKISYGLSNRFRNLFIKKEQHLFDTAGKTAVTSSIEGAVGDPNLPSYNAAKGGVNLMSQSAALALAKYHIRVNTVNPGLHRDRHGE